MELPKFKYNPNAYELDLFEEISNGDPETINYLTKDGSFVGYLFQCTKCGKHRLHADCD